MRSEQGCSYRQDSASQNLKPDQGYTIIEVLLAVTIFAVGILAIAALQYSAINVNSRAGHITERATLAQDKLEELMALSWDSHWLEDVSAAPDGKDSEDEKHEATSGGYAITWAITDVDMPPTDGENDAKKISVTVAEGSKRNIISSIKSKF